MAIILIVVLVLAFVGSIWMDRVYRNLPGYELRRRARNQSDRHSAAIYKMGAYGPTFELLNWLRATVSGLFLLIWAARTNLWLAVVVGTLMSLVIVSGRSSRPIPGWQMRYIVFMSPLIARVLGALQPVLGKPANFITGFRPAHPPTGLYEKQDLLDLLKHQPHQPGSRFDDLELAVARGALSFGDKTVGHVMTPRAKLKMVTAADAVGPHLLDELHASGQSGFPVVKEISRSANPEVTGSVYLADLIAHGDSGKVRDVVQHKAYFINESQNLREALAAFQKTKSHFLVVVNNFEEVVGGLELGQVLEQILGHKLSSEFENYDDLTAVAGHNQ